LKSKNGYIGSIFGFCRLVSLAADLLPAIARLERVPSINLAPNSHTCFNNEWYWAKFQAEEGLDHFLLEQGNKHLRILKTQRDFGVGTDLATDSRVLLRKNQTKTSRNEIRKIFSLISM
jgi:hypothetical protein